MTGRDEKRAERDRKEMERADQRAALREAIANEIKVPSPEPDIVPVVATLATIITGEGVRWTAKEAKHHCYEMTREGFPNHSIYLTGREFLNFIYVNKCKCEGGGRLLPFIMNREKAERYLSQFPSNAVWETTTGLRWRCLVGRFNNETELPEDEYIALPAGLNKKFVARDLVKAIMQKHSIHLFSLTRRLGIDHATLLKLYHEDFKPSEKLLQRIAKEFPDFANDCNKLMKKKITATGDFGTTVMNFKEVKISRLRLIDDEGKLCGLLEAIHHPLSIPSYYCMDFLQWKNGFKKLLEEICDVNKQKKLCHYISDNEAAGALGVVVDLWNDGLNDEFVRLLVDRLHHPLLLELLKKDECKISELKTTMLKISDARIIKQVITDSDEQEGNR